MKKIFWNVGIEIYEDGTVKAAVLRVKEADKEPSDFYMRGISREVFRLWFATEEEANEAVRNALAMNENMEVAA
jgi:hypothetical protein